jgi:hypothetical protein
MTELEELNRDFKRARSSRFADDLAQARHHLHYVRRGLVDRDSRFAGSPLSSPR